MHPLYEQHTLTLLGRLKIHALTKLSGSAEKIPSDRTVYGEVFRLWKSNPTAGLFYFNLIRCDRIDRAIFPAHFSADAAQSVLRELSRPEYFERIFAEGRVDGEDASAEYGCMILGHRRPNGEPGYYAAVYSDNDSDRCAFCSLVPDGKEGNGYIEILTSEGWKNISTADAGNLIPVRIMLASLLNHIGGIGPKTVPIDDLPTESVLDPPVDDELMRRLKTALEGKMQITSGITPLRSVFPHNLDFCLLFSAAHLLPVTNRIHRGFRPALLVYWSGSKFVMSDDYPVYLAYKQLEVEDVPVAILGDFPNDAANSKKQGGAELLPPIGVGMSAVLPSPVSPKFQQWRLDEKLRSRFGKSVPGDLIAIWMTFADLLGDEDVDERELHQFILEHPAVLSAYGKRLDSEIRLGDKYRIDLAMSSSGVRDEVTLVELEHHRHDVFTVGGQTRSEITHAVQQVQDWFRWLRENASDQFAASLKGIPPKGLVIAGRSRDFAEEHRNRLAHLNSTSSVPIITYDELLDRLRDLILTRLDSSES